MISTIAGAAGAAALTLAHEAGRQLFADAPRMDVLGERAVAAATRRGGRRGTDDALLHGEALLGDMVSNSMYFAMVGTGPSADVWRRGLTLGVTAGFGALTLPRPLGLGSPPGSRSPRNQVLTVAYYVLGGLVAAAVADALQRRR